MKKLLALAVLGFLFLNVQGQWYSRQFNVNSIDELNQTQLNYALERAEANLKTGKILTYSGIGAFAVGTLVAATGVNGFWNGLDEGDLNRYAAGSVLMLLGMGSTIVGVPFWVAGSRRKRQVEIALLRFDASAYTGFQPTQQYGLSLTLNF